MTSADAASPAGELALAIPPGYVRLPLNDPDEQLGKVRDLFADVAVGEQRALVDGVLQALRALLADLATVGARYCGVGRHESPSSGELVTSTLVVSVLEFPDRNDPSALLQALLVADRGAGEGESGEVGRTGSGRPVTYRERVRALPAPTVPGAEPPAAEISPVYQIEARIPSFDGTKLATVELSTPFLADGPEFGSMVLQMAVSATFADEPPTDD